MEEKIKSIYCYNCKCKTQQKVIFNKGVLDSPEIIGYDKNGNKLNSFFTIVANIYEITECCGCKKINLNVYERKDPRIEDEIILTYPNNQVRDIPKWIVNLKINYIGLFREVYTSLNCGNITLPLIGARTLLDLYIVEKIGDVGTFKNKLEKLLEQNFITQVQKDFLSVALEYGNAAAHRGYVAELEEVNKVLDIIESLFREDALKVETKKLKRNIPRK